MGDYRSKSVRDSHVEGADQILCGLNRTRVALNVAVRRARGFSGPYPRRGERVVCLRNDHRSGLLNGATWEVLSSEIVSRSVRMTVRQEGDGAERDVDTYRAFWEGRAKERDIPARFDRFDFAYALTVHKAQGSQWAKVTMFDDSLVLRKAFGIEPSRWLYTGVTRASESLTVVEPFGMYDEEDGPPVRVRVKGPGPA